MPNHSLDVRYWHLADIETVPSNVRFGFEGLQARSARSMAWRERSYGDEASA